MNKIRMAVLALFAVIGVAGLLHGAPRAWMLLGHLSLLLQHGRVTELFVLTAQPIAYCLLLLSVALTFIGLQKHKAGNAPPLIPIRKLHGGILSVLAVAFLVSLSSQNLLMAAMGFSIWPVLYLILWFVLFRSVFAEETQVQNESENGNY